MNPALSKISPRWLCLALLCGVTLFFFWSYFLLDQTLYAGDTAFVFVPFRTFLLQHLAAGKIPLWNPYLFGGTPALAESQYQVFYPINLLMLLLGAARGMGWILAIHVAWMAVGTFLFLRHSLGLGRIASLFGAISFSFGASVQMRLGIPVYTNAAAWIPWILWGYDHARRRGGFWFIVPPIAFALQLVVGGAQYSYYTLVLLFGYHFFCLQQERANGSNHGHRAWTVLGFTLGMSVALAMAQLLPEMELARLSDRGTNASYEFAIAGSLLPRHYFIVLFFPKFYGLYTSAPLDGFGTSSECSYLGAATLALLAAATVAPARAQLRFWTLGVLLSLFLALGVNNPLYPFLFRFVPGTAMFRNPGNWLLITSFCCAALAAFGLQAILDSNQKARQRAFIGSVVALVVAVVILVSPLGSFAFVPAQRPYGPWGQVALFGIVAVLFGLLWRTPRPASPLLSSRRVTGAILALLVLDLFAVSQDMEVNQTVLASDLDVVPAPVTRLKAVNTSTAPERFWTDNGALPLEAWVLGQNLSPDEASLFRARQGLTMRALMPSCVAAEWGVPGLTGAWGSLMPLRRHPRPIYEDKSAPALKQRWWRLLNTRYHLNPGAAPQSDWSVVSSEPPAIYRDPQAFPRAFWIENAVSATPETALSMVNDEKFDPRRSVVLEMGTSAPTTSNPKRELQAANFTRYDENRLDLNVNAPADGHLVVMDTFYPGWHARIDGRKTPILPANFVGRAVAVPAGTHRVEMWFEPESVRVGVFISLLSLTLLSAIASSSWSAGRQKKCSIKEKSS